MDNNATFPSIITDNGPLKVRFVDNGDGTYSLATNSSLPSLAKSITFDGTDGKGKILTAATLSTALTGNNNDLDYTAQASGAAGNNITVAYIDPAANDQSLSIVVDGNAITVNLATDSGGAITSTAGDIDTAIAGDAGANALVAVANKAGNDGTGVVTAMAATALAGGADGTIDLFNVTGAALVAVIAICTTNLAGATATLETGVTGATASLIDTELATDIDAGDVEDHTGLLAAGTAPAKDPAYPVTSNIFATPKVANITAGVITFYCFYQLLDAASTIEVA